MFISKNKDQFLVALLGIIYGGIFFPFYTEFIEFGLVLSGKFEFSNFNIFYSSVGNTPSFLYILSKALVNNVNNLDLANIIASAIISCLSFVSIFNFFERFLPNGKYNIFIPIALTSIFFPNYFLYPLWYPTNFFVWGQIGFYLFIFLISISDTSWIKRALFLFFLVISHPVYGGIGLCYIFFENYINKNFNFRNIVLTLTSFLIGFLIVTSSGFKQIIVKDKLITHQTYDYNVNKNDSEKTLSRNYNHELDNYHSHSSNYQGDFTVFFKKLIFIFLSLVPAYLIFINRPKFDKNIYNFNTFIFLIILATIASSFISIFTYGNGILGEMMSFITMSSPNRVLNVVFLIYLLIFLKFLQSKKETENFSTFSAFKTSFLIILMLPIPLYFLPIFLYEPYPSLVEIVLFCLVIYLITFKLFNKFFGKKILNNLRVKNFSFDVLITKSKYKVLIVLFILVGFGSLTVRLVENNIGPKYFVSLFEKNEFIKKLKSLKNDKSQSKNGVLVSYDVHGIKGMNVTQFTNMPLILPLKSTPMYQFKNELKSIGCYNNERLTWISIKDHIKRCYENKTEEEWTKAFNTLKINALIVPSHYNIKIKNKFTDNTFSLYTID